MNNNSISFGWVCLQVQTRFSRIKMELYAPPRLFFTFWVKVVSEYLTPPERLLGCFEAKNLRFIII